MKTILCILAICTAAMGEIIAIKKTDGKQINVRILSLEDGVVKLHLHGNQSKVFTVPLADLDEPSQKAVTKEVASLKQQGLTDLIGCQVKANSLPTGREEEKRYEASWGSYDKSVYKARTLKTTVTASAGATCKVHVMWIGRDMESGDESIVSDETLAAKPNGNAVFASALFVENDAKYVMLGERDRSGIKYIGWVVAVLDSSDKIVASTASKPSLLDYLPKKEN